MFRYILLSLCMIGFLSGCGGGGGGGGALIPSPEPVPQLEQSTELNLDSAQVILENTEGNLVTIELRADEINPITITLSDLAQEQVGVEFSGQLSDLVRTDVDGNTVTLVQRELIFTITSAVKLLTVEERVSIAVDLASTVSPIVDTVTVSTLTVRENNPGTLTITSVDERPVGEGALITEIVVMTMTITQEITVTVPEQTIVEITGVSTVTMTGIGFTSVTLNTLPHRIIDGERSTEAISAETWAQFQRNRPPLVMVTITSSTEDTIITTNVSVYILTVAELQTITIYHTYALQEITTTSIIEEKVVQENTIGIATLSLGSTIAYDSSGNLIFIDLPPPSDSDGINYQVAEFNENYGLGNINADKAYQRGYFGQGVTVGILDSGALTTHSDLTSNLLPGRTYRPLHPFTSTRVTLTTSNDINPRGHGTFVAGIIGATRDGNGLHGVAPSVRLLPVAHDLFIPDLFPAYEFILSNHVQVVNNSYGIDRQFFIHIGTLTNVVVEAPLLSGSRVTSFAISIATMIENEDVVFVWSAGNEGWNSETGLVGVYDTPLAALLGGAIETISAQAIISATVVGSADTLEDLGYSADESGFSSVMPLVDRRLLGKWVTSIATDANDEIGSFSSACGRAMYWCLAAPGVSVRSTSIDSGSPSYASFSGTSFSAPHISGALAVLRSRLTDMPMPAVLAILFTTATDLGDTGVDPVYGHGLVNLEKAITVQGKVNLIIPGQTVTASRTSQTSGALLSESKLRFPNQFLHLANQLEGLSVAVNFIGDYYYDTPLSSLIDIETEKHSNLGQAASNMITNSFSQTSNGNYHLVESPQDGLVKAFYQGDFLHFSYSRCLECVDSVWDQYQLQPQGLPFFADSPQAIELGWQWNKSWSIFAASGFDNDAKETSFEHVGLRFQHQGQKFGLLTEFSHSWEHDSLLGGNYQGAFAVKGSEVNDIHLQSQLNLNEDWQLYAGYNYGWVTGKSAKKSFIRSFNNIRYDGLRLGLGGASVLLPNDRMEFGFSRETKIRSGKIGIRYASSAGHTEFIEDLHLNLDTGYDVIDKDLNLSGEANYIWRWGYLFKPGEHSTMGFGLEYQTRNTDKNLGAASVSWVWKIN